MGGRERWKAEIVNDTGKEGEGRQKKITILLREIVSKKKEREGGRKGERDREGGSVNVCVCV